MIFSRLRALNMLSTETPFEVTESSAYSPPLSSLPQCFKDMIRCDSLSNLSKGFIPSMLQRLVILVAFCWRYNRESIMSTQICKRFSRKKDGSWRFDDMMAVNKLHFSWAKNIIPLSKWLHVKIKSRVQPFQKTQGGISDMKRINTRKTHISGDANLWNASNILPRLSQLITPAVSHRNIKSHSTFFWILDVQVNQKYFIFPQKEMKISAVAFNSTNLIASLMQFVLSHVPIV